MSACLPFLFLPPISRLIGLAGLARPEDEGSLSRTPGDEVAPVHMPVWQTGGEHNSRSYMIQVTQQGVNRDGVGSVCGVAESINT